QSALLPIATKPLPLQEFWPLQLLLADLQDDWPLQELTPSHFTLPSSAAAAVNEAVANMIAAAAARAMLPVFRVFINASPVSCVAEIRSLDRMPKRNLSLPVREWTPSPCGRNSTPRCGPVAQFVALGRQSVATLERSPAGAI